MNTIKYFPARNTSNITKLKISKQFERSKSVLKQFLDTIVSSEKVDFFGKRVSFWFSIKFGFFSGLKFCIFETGQKIWSANALPFSFDDAIFLKVLKLDYEDLEKREGLVWWRTRGSRATCHNTVTVTRTKHFLESPSFQKLKWS